MTSYWSRIVGHNKNKCDKLPTNHKYHKVSTQSSPMQLSSNKKSDDPPHSTSIYTNHNIKKSSPYLKSQNAMNTNHRIIKNNRNINSALREINIDDQYSDDSELDDDDFPQATQEQNFLIDNSNKKNKNKTNVTRITTSHARYYIYFILINTQNRKYIIIYI